MSGCDDLLALQETCEEDLLKVKEDYFNQCTQLDKSEAKALQKKEEYIKKAQAEFEQKVEVGSYASFHYVWTNCCITT